MTLGGLTAGETSEEVPAAGCCQDDEALSLFPTFLLSLRERCEESFEFSEVSLIVESVMIGTVLVEFVAAC